MAGGLSTVKVPSTLASPRAAAPPPPGWGLPPLEPRGSARWPLDPRHRGGGGSVGASPRDAALPVPPPADEAAADEAAAGSTAAARAGARNWVNFLHGELTPRQIYG
jgi:hypothetical protein